MGKVSLFNEADSLSDGDKVSLSTSELADVVLWVAYLQSKGFLTDEDTLAANAIALVNSGGSYIGSDVDAALVQVAGEISSLFTLVAEANNVVFEATESAFPATGDSGVLYVAYDGGEGTPKAYVWTGSGYESTGGDSDITGEIIRDLLSALPEGDKLQASAIEGITSGSAPSYTTLTRPGISVEVGYYGTAPTLTGDAGAYTLNFLEDAGRFSVTVTAASASTATNNNDMTFSLVRGDGRNDYTNAVIVDTSDNSKVLDNPKTKGIERRETVTSAGTVANSFIGIGASLSAFRIHFS